MTFALLAAAIGAIAAPPGNLLDQAFRGREGSRWSGIVLVERPGKDGPDTAKACRDGVSERLEFHDVSVLMAGDSTVFLRNGDRSAVVHPRHRMPPPPTDADVKIVGQTRVLGRAVLVMEISGAEGPERRVWVDTALPAVLKEEAIGNAGRRGPQRHFLSIRPGTGCPPDAFRIPAGWTVRRGGGPGEGGEGPHHGRRHEAASLEEVVAQVGFEPPVPPWLPAGFLAKSYAWVETREGKAVQILYSNGPNSISIFWRPMDGPPPYCPGEGCRDHKGQPVFFGQVGKLGLSVTGDLPPADLEKVAGIRR